MGSRTTGCSSPTSRWPWSTRRRLRSSSGVPGLDVDLAPIDALATEPEDGEPASLAWGRYRLIGIGESRGRRRRPRPCSSSVPRSATTAITTGTLDALLALFESVPVTDAVDPDAIAALLAPG